jgi:Major Facilitator Superfamily
MRRLLSHRDARTYIAGQSLSVIGDSALWLAMGIWVKILTGSNSSAGLTFFAFVCGCMLAPVSGVIVDRVRRRPLLIAVNLSTAAGVCSLLLVHGRGQVWLIYVVMLGYGAANSLIASAQTALLPLLVPCELLGEANSVLQMASQGPAPAPGVPRRADQPAGRRRAGRRRARRAGHAAHERARAGRRRPRRLHGRGAAAGHGLAAAGARGERRARHLHRMDQRRRGHCRDSVDSRTLSTRNRECVAAGR